MRSDVTLAPVPDGFYYNTSVSEDIRVNGGSTLTLLPGVQMRLSGDLVVEGAHLAAMGAPSGVVKLTSLNSAWEGLHLRGGGSAEWSTPWLPTATPTASSRRAARARCRRAIHS